MLERIRVSVFLGNLLLRFDRWSIVRLDGGFSVFVDGLAVDKRHSCGNELHQVRSVESSPAALGLLRQFENHRQVGLATAAALRFVRPMLHRRKHALNRIRRFQTLPMLGREIVKRQKHILILQQTVDGLRIFRTKRRFKTLHLFDRQLTCRLLFDLAKHRLALVLQAVRQLREHVALLVKPATLLLGRRKYLSQCIPKSE